MRIQYPASTEDDDPQLQRSKRLRFLLNHVVNQCGLRNMTDIGEIAGVSGAAISAAIRYGRLSPPVADRIAKFAGEDIITRDQLIFLD